MAVDLETLVEPLENEVNPPGTDLYPTVTNTQWVSRLRDAFWEAKLNRAFTEFTLQGDNIVPISVGGDDMPREQQQLIVLYASYVVTLRAYQNLNSGFRAKAGPVEFEQQKSATTLKALLDAITARMKQAIEDGTGTSTGTMALVLDGLVTRSAAISDGDLYFVR